MNISKLPNFPHNVAHANRQTEYQLEIQSVSRYNIIADANLPEIMVEQNISII